ncbi:MAG: general secretion pathway protein GspK [Calothrix sp. SM1_5_4]|nr:general secretion pathway protein GspK [Calothrix sp. SM1_5_4]
MTLLTFIALEVSYDTSVDYVVATQQVNRIKAYYAAKSAVELSLLRVSLYKQAVAALSGSLGGNVSMLDPIWSFPFMWPPTAIGGKLTEVDKGILKDAVGESLMQAQYSVSISPEGGRIDINDLGSDIKALKKIMIEQVVKIFKSEIEHNEEFGKKYSGFNFQELAHNIADYVDEDRESLNGGDESALYRDLGEANLEMPPNRPLRTVEELHQVAGMTDELYEVLAPKITVFGTKGINVNYAGKEILMALDPSMNEEAVDKAIARRSDPKQGGSFKDDRDFFGFLGGYGVNAKAMEEAKLPLLYDQEFNFRISATGLSQNVKREITAITYDYPNLTQRLVDLLDKQEEQDKGPKPATGAKPDGTPADTGGKPDDKKGDEKRRFKRRRAVLRWCIGKKTDSLEAEI